MAFGGPTMVGLQRERAGSRKSGDAPPATGYGSAAVAQAASEHGLTRIGRLTANLLRPVPIAELEIAVTPRAL